MKRYGFIVALLLLLAAVATGCGASDDKAADSDSRKVEKKGSSGSSRDNDSVEKTASDAKQWTAEPAMSIKKNGKYHATLQTDKGAIEVELMPKSAPHAVNNFVFLANNRFYDGVKFHRIIAGFMIQTGDPEGTGMGGPGYTITDDPVKDPYKAGTLAMANTGQPNSAGSQFFIVHKDSTSLPPTYSIFGKVTKGMDVVDKIASVEVEANQGGEPSSPVEPVILKSVRIAEG